MRSALTIETKSWISDIKPDDKLLDRGDHFKNLSSCQTLGFQSFERIITRATTSTFFSMPFPSSSSKRATNNLSALTRSNRRSPKGPGSHYPIQEMLMQRQIECLAVYNMADLVISYTRDLRRMPALFSSQVLPLMVARNLSGTGITDLRAAT